MKLCFDATRFGSGLDGAVDLAKQRNLTYVEYSFAPFAAGRSNKSQDEKEQKYFEGIRQQADQAGVRFAILNLDYAVDPLDKRSVKQFLPMMQKLTALARTLSCPKIGFSVAPGRDPAWVGALAEQYKILRDGLKESGQSGSKALPADQKSLAHSGAAIGADSDDLYKGSSIDFGDFSSDDDLSYVLRLSTPVQYRGVSLKEWRLMEPEEWRQLLSLCEGLTFSYSPGDCLWLGIDYLQNLGSFNQAISHVVAHDVEINRTLLQDSGMFGPLFWRYRLAGKGQVDWRQAIELLKLYDFGGVLSLQFDDEFVADDDLSLSDALDEGVKYFAPLLKG
ncbi:MAG: hypothetical protein IPP57_12445 [Candidatus Obscuribacter sp.]|nr:hypothetical protein [Candidatus Obscuribacter sp.]